MNESIEKIGGPPKKKGLRDKANQLNEESCVCELIDNCIDYWTTTGKKQPLRIEIKIEREAGGSGIRPIKGVKLKWNMSIPREKFDDLVTLGSEETDQEGIIGLWGQGAKLAMHGIARAWTLTSYSGKKMHTLACPRDYLEDDKDWGLPLKTSTLSSAHEDESIFESVELNEFKWKEAKKDEEFHDPEPVDIEAELRNTLSRKYSEYGGFGPGMHLLMGNEPIELISAMDEATLRRDFLWIPGFEPHYNLFEIRIPGEKGDQSRTLKVKAFVGLHRVPSKESAGVYLYGNNRLFLSNYKGAPLYKGYFPKDVRVRVYLFLTGRSKDIMWGIPEKDGLNQEHPLVDDIANIVRTSVEPYGQVVTAVSEHLDLYCLQERLPTLLEQANLTGKNGEAVARIINRVRELNTPNLRLYTTNEGREILQPRCLNWRFRTDVSTWIKDSKDELMTYADFHLSLAEYGIADLRLAAEIDSIRTEFGIERYKEKKGPGPMPPEETPEEEDEPPKSTRVKRTTMNSLNNSLDKIGEIIKVNDRDKVLRRVNTALNRIARELSQKGYTNKRKQIFRELFGLK